MKNFALISSLLLATLSTSTFANITKEADICASSSSSDDGNVASNTIDDNLSTRWSAQGGGQWLQLDLCDTSPLSEIKIDWYKGEQRKAHFRIDVSMDGTSWEKAAIGSSDGESEQFETINLAVKLANYVRIVGFGNSLNPWNSIVEAELHYIDPNTTITPISISSSSNDGNTPENAFDGELSTRWSALGTGEFINADLGKEFFINDIEIAWHKGDERIAKYRILASNDEQSWKDITSGSSSGLSQELEPVDTESFSARYVRIVGLTNNSNSWNSITEIRMSGTAMESGQFVYDSWTIGSLPLSTIEGDNILFSFDSEVFPEFSDNATQIKVLEIFDKAVENYRVFGLNTNYPIVGFDTHTSFPGNGKASLAIVFHTCGAGCGAEAKAEINETLKRKQIDGSYFASSTENTNYSNDPTEATSWWLALYELGRGSIFPFYDALGYRQNSDGSATYASIGNAFPNVMTHVIMEDLGFTPAEIQEKSLNSIATYKEAYLDYIDQNYVYLDWNPSNGDLVSVFGLDSNDIMSVVIYEYYLRYGRDALFDFLEKAATIASAPNTPLEAACNLSDSMDIALINRGYVNNTASIFLTDEFAFPVCF